MEIIIYVVLGLLVLFFIFKKKSKNNPEYHLKESDQYLDTFNDAIRYYNKLSNGDKKFVFGFLMRFAAEMGANDGGDAGFFRDWMLDMQKRRHQAIPSGPNHEWVAASFVESICMMGIIGETDLINQFIDEIMSTPFEIDDD